MLMSKGKENSTNKLFSKPKASLLKAMLIHSAVKMKGYSEIPNKIIESTEWPSNWQGFGLVILEK